MIWNSEVLLDFLASIVLLSLLAYSYGVLRRQLPGTKLAPQLLGALFGLVAALQMHLPLEPIPGLIVDLRAIPLILAGAFLGLRGMVIAMFIAALARTMIGGVGWVSGVFAIMIACGLGMFWDYLTLSIDRRGMRSLALLAAMTPLHLVAVVLLPADIAWLFLSGAGPVLAGFYLMAIPLIGIMLEHQRIAMQFEARQRAMVRLDAEGVFCGPEALALNLARTEATGKLQRGLTVIGLRLCGGNVRAALWGAEVEVGLLRDLHLRLRAALPEAAGLGMVRADIILAFLPAMTPDALSETVDRIRVDACARPFDVPGMAPVRMHIALAQADFMTIPTYARALHVLGWETSRADGPARRSMTSETDRACVSDIARLFQTADRLLEACEVDRHLSGRKTGDI